MLLRRRAQRLRQQRPFADRDGELPAARLEDRAVGPEQVAEVHREEPFERLVAQDVAARLQLDAPRAVIQVQERHLALAAASVETTGHAHAHVRLLTVLEALVGCLRLRDRGHAPERVRERVDPRLPQCFELATADGEEL